jgi:hypothetical protein
MTRPSGPRAARQGVCQVIEGQMKLVIHLPNGHGAETVYINQISGAIGYDADKNSFVIRDLHGTVTTPKSSVSMALSSTAGLFSKTRGEGKDYDQAEARFVQNASIPGRVPSPSPK